MPSFIKWEQSAIGRKIDVDKTFGDQCVDVIMDYVQFLWPGKSWRQLIGLGNAKDLFRTASPSYFTKIPNDPKNVKQIPKQGDIIVYNGWSGNPFGHTAVIGTTNYQGAHNIEQDGFNPGGRCYQVFRPYPAFPIIGWLRPRTSLVAKVIQAVQPTPPATLSYYVVHAGDTVDGISRRYGLSIANSYAAFRKLNPAVTNVNKLAINQKVRVR